LTVHPDDDPHEGKIALVVVPDDQLSLAIGREGQNARLAAKLTGWRIDIKGATESAREAIATAQADAEVLDKLGPIGDLIPTAQVALERHAGQALPWNTEELQLMRAMIDGVHNILHARKLAEREKARQALQAERAAKAEEQAAEIDRREQLKAQLARIPAAAYEMPLAELGLSTRVLNHIEKSDISNVGQIHERLANGDESLLAIDGIGPKGLAEIKQTIEDKGLGLLPEQPPEPAPSEPAPAEAAVEAVVEAEAAGAEAPTEASAAAEAAPVAEGQAAPLSVEMPVVELDEVLEEDEDELDSKGKDKKKGKRKDRTLVFDEAAGRVVAKKQRKSGRSKDIFDLLDEEI
jgi:N utilization substance protein A